MPACTPRTRQHPVHRLWGWTALRLLAASLVVVLAAPALAGSMAPSLGGKSKLKLKGIGKNKAAVELALVHRDDPSDTTGGRFGIEGSLDMHGATLGTGNKRRLLLDPTAVPAVEAFLAGEVARMLDRDARETVVDELSIKRLMVEVAEKKEDIARLEERASVERAKLTRIQILIEAGVATPSEQDRAAAELAETLRSIERHNDLLVRLERRLAEFRLGSPQPVAVSIEITRADLSSKLAKKATRLSVGIRFQFEAVVERTGERIRGSYRAKARGAAFDVVDLEPPVVDQEALKKLLERLLGARR